MNKYIISLKPYYFYHIYIAGDKPVEVRKADIRGKMYSYCTKDMQSFKRIQFRNEAERKLMLSLMGKVGGEFVVEKTEKFKTVFIPKYDLGYRAGDQCHEIDGDITVFERPDGFIDTNFTVSDIAKTGLTPKELSQYVPLGKKGYFLHIAAQKLYEKPRALSDFFVEGECNSENCCGCKNFHMGKGWLDGSTCDEDDCMIYGIKPITRAPQSYMRCEPYLWEKKR